ncbi:hypothetical protein OHA21_14930 [Actinoplanes sp. NBC_00393]|uniref:hypothetical protein n=1 Tax=Actinoplanes sp. NBC_00393 TaxID=2975953 RepID=UPI002E232439
MIVTRGTFSRAAHTGHAGGHGALPLGERHRDATGAAALIEQLGLCFPLLCVVALSRRGPRWQ